VTVQVSVALESGSESVFVAARVDKGGCQVAGAGGVFFWVNTTGYWTITTDLGIIKTLLYTYVHMVIMCLQLTKRQLLLGSMIS